MHILIYKCHDCGEILIYMDGGNRRHMAYVASILDGLL